MIRDKPTLNIKNPDNEIPILLQVSSSFCLNGKYNLQGFDLIGNRPHSFLIDPNIDLPDTIDPIIDSWPKFDGNKEIISIEDFLNSRLEVYKYFKIKYASFHGKVTNRTIEGQALTDFKVFKISGNDEKQIIKHFVGYCLLRNAVRHFRLDRIQSIQVLNVKK